MTSPRYDFHMHTKYLGCANETMEIPAIISECERLGVTALGITDHLNSLDRLDDHRPIKDDLAQIETDMSVWFGVELNYTGCDEDFVYDEGIRDELGFQFAIGGIHGTYLETYDLTKIIDIQHRHHIKTCQNPLVDVLVHPYWFGKGEFDHNDWPWFDTMSVVPESYARELGQTARDTGTAIEINANACLLSGHGERYAAEYADYIAIIAEEGAMFSVGSDAHAVGSLAGVEASWQMVEKLGIAPERIYRPTCAPMIG
jgi:histidinol phosphatase-like PHP family hydrolase